MAIKEQYVEVELLKEPISTYLLEDDTILTVRFIVNYVICINDDKGKIDFKPDYRIVNSSYVPEILRGEPTKEYLNPSKYIINDDVKIKEVMRDDIGIYKFKNDTRLLIITNNLKQIKKTSIFTQNKMPRYIVNGSSNFGITDPMTKPD
jgi:hypothetical protein